ncbi:hypothetical protein BZG04_15795 [Salinivibrio kushneri]|uniref:fimbrial protein n=1 Tax=Salinivibrio kushneri TaxID=1908198 RepID=UPI00098964CB|nr:fimbrial protein [Salinivibrio kushneri]OOE32060.1 hypothetical protein BZG04_15795 [Salinivibrio kushneri]
MKFLTWKKVAYKIFIKNTCFIALLAFNKVVWANCDSYSLTMYPDSTIVNSLPANGLSPGRPLLNSNGNTWAINGGREYVFDMRWGGCAGNIFGMGKAYADPLGKVIPGIYYREGGKVFNVFDTGVPGIGYAVGIRDYRASLDKEIPLRDYTVQTYPYSGSTGKWVSTIGYRARLIFVVTKSSLVSGKYVIPSQQIANFWALGFREGGGDAPPHTKLLLQSTTLTIEAQGCEYTSPEHQVVQMPAINRNFDNHQSDRYEGNFSISLVCDPNISVYATMTDVNNPGYTGNILKPSPSSVAKGVGLQLFKYNDTTPINFGPDSPHKGNINQWYVGGGSNTPERSYTIPFKARYIKLPNESDITPGEFQAEASITFSYQ